MITSCKMSVIYFLINKNCVSMYVCTHECMHAWLCMDMNDYVQIAMYVCFAIYVTIKEGPVLAKIVRVLDAMYVCMYGNYGWICMTICI